MCELTDRIGIYLEIIDSSKKICIILPGAGVIYILLTSCYITKLATLKNLNFYIVRLDTLHKIIFTTKYCFHSLRKTTLKFLTFHTRHA